MNNILFIFMTAIFLSSCVAKIDRDLIDICDMHCLQHQGTKVVGKKFNGNICCECVDGEVIDPVVKFR